MRNIVALCAVLLLAALSVVPSAIAQQIYVTEHDCGDCVMDNLPCQTHDSEHAIEHSDCVLGGEWAQACYHKVTGPNGYHKETRTAVCSDVRHGAIRCGNGTANPGLWLWGAYGPTSEVTYSPGGGSQGRIIWLVHRVGEVWPRIAKECSCGSSSNPGCYAEQSPDTLPECLKR